MTEDRKRNAAQESRHMQEIHPSPEGLAALAMAISEGNRYDAIMLSYEALLHGLRYFEAELAKECCIALAGQLTACADVLQDDIDAAKPKPH